MDRFQQPFFVRAIIIKLLGYNGHNNKKPGLPISLKGVSQLKGKESIVGSFMLKIISIVLIVIIINAIGFRNYDSQIGSSQVNIEGTIAYSDLKEYEQELKENILQIKKELAYKEDYLASLDEELIELEHQYIKLLEENKKISDRLDSLNAAKHP